MRVALISYEYPPQQGYGGVGTYTFRLAGGLGRFGHEVVVLAGPSDEPEIPQPNVTVHRIPAQYGEGLRWRALRFAYWRFLSPLMNWSNRGVWHWLRWDLATCEALQEIDRKTPFDVVEAPEHAANGFFAGQLQRWPTVIRTHGPWDLFFRVNRTKGATLNRVLAYLERQSARYAHTLTSPSHTMAGFIQNHWQLAQAPRVLANFMDVPRQRPALPGPKEPQRILCAGRIERFKGQDVLVRAFAKIAQAHPQAELLLVGPDQWSPSQPFSDVLRTLVKDPAVRSRIHLIGPLTLRAVQDELNKCALAAVCSSGFESFSFSTLEAMAAGRPIVASASGAIPELLAGGRCGMLSPPGNVDELARNMSELLSDRALAASYAAAAHARARETYDTLAVMPGFIEMYARTRECFSGTTEFPERTARLQTA